MLERPKLIKGIIYSLYMKNEKIFADVICENNIIKRIKLSHGHGYSKLDPIAFYEDANGKITLVPVPKNRY